MRRDTIVPLVYHVDTRVFNKSQYVELVQFGWRLSPDMATIDLNLDDQTISSLLEARGTSKVIAHLSIEEGTGPSWDQDFWLSAYARAAKLGFDMVRFSRPISSLQENFTIHGLRERVSRLPNPIPLIAYNYGHTGRSSIPFSSTLTSVTHPQVNSPIGLQVTAHQATHALYASLLFDPMQFYIVGANADYSLSPVMHNAAYKVCGMPHSFQKHVTPTLDSVESLFTNHNFGGVAATLPFKLEIASKARWLSKHAKAIGAANTLLPVRRIGVNAEAPSKLDLLNERNQAGPIQALYGEKYVRHHPADSDEQLMC